MTALKRGQKGLFAEHYDFTVKCNHFFFCTVLPLLAWILELWPKKSCIRSHWPWFLSLLNQVLLSLCQFLKHSVHGAGVDAWMDTLLLPARPHSYTYSNVGLNPRDSVIQNATLVYQLWCDGGLTELKLRSVTWHIVTHEGNPVAGVQHSCFSCSAVSIPSCVYISSGSC